MQCILPICFSNFGTRSQHKYLTGLWQDSVGIWWDLRTRLPDVCNTLLVYCWVYLLEELGGSLLYEVIGHADTIGVFQVESEEAASNASTLSQKRIPSVLKR